MLALVQVQVSNWTDPHHKQQFFEEQLEKPPPIEVFKRKQAEHYQRIWNVGGIVP